MRAWTVLFALLVACDPAETTPVDTGDESTCDDCDDDGFTADDCDDEDAAINPDAEDTVGDDVDNNCDGIDGVDADLDGFASEASGGDDCDDDQDTVNPEAEDTWYDGIDADCDGTCDWDQDGDGYLESSANPADNGPCDDAPNAPAVVWEDDCDDSDPSVFDGNTIIDSLPKDGDTDAFYATDIRVELDLVPSQSADITVDDASGNPVTGTVTVDNHTLIFTPDASLEPNTGYDVTITLDCGSEIISFTTSEVGAPVTTDLTDRTYAVDIGAGTFIKPPGVGTLISQQLTSDLLLGVVAESSSTLDVRLGFSEENSAPPVQDECIATVDQTTDFSDDPLFTIGPDDITLELSGITMDLLDFELSGAFAPDGSYIQGMRVAGIIDTRPLVPLIDPNGGDDAVCQLVSAFTVSCVTCPTDQQPYCLELDVQDIPADQVSGLTLVERTEAEIDSDQTCDGSSCSTVGSQGALVGSSLLLLALMRRRES